MGLFDLKYVWVRANEVVKVVFQYNCCFLLHCTVWQVLRSLHQLESLKWLLNIVFSDCDRIWKLRELSLCTLIAVEGQLPCVYKHYCVSTDWLFICWHRVRKIFILLRLASFGVPSVYSQMRNIHSGVSFRTAITNGPRNCYRGALGLRWKSCTVTAMQATKGDEL